MRALGGGPDGTAPAAALTALAATALGRALPGAAAARLDEARLRFYRLAPALSLVEGPLRLLDTDVPDRDWWREVAEGNLTRVLAAG